MDYRIEAEITYFHSTPLQLLIADVIKIGEIICFRKLPAQYYTKSVAIVIETQVPSEAVERYLKNLRYPEYCPTAIVVKKFTTYGNTQLTTPPKNKEPLPAILDQRRLVIQLPDLPMTEEEWMADLLKTFVKFGEVEYVTIFHNKKTGRKTAFMRYFTKEAAKKALKTNTSFPCSIANERKRKASDLPQSKVTHPECGYRVDRGTLSLHVDTCKVLTKLELHTPIDGQKRLRLDVDPAASDLTLDTLSITPPAEVATTDQQTPAVTSQRPT